MKIKYSPCKWNPYAELEGLPDTEIKYINENSITIDNELYEFDPDSVAFENLATLTDGIIIDAFRNESDELYLTVRRFYTESCTEWDNGEYHEING